MAFWVAAAIAGSAILGAAGSVQSGKAQASAVRGNAALNEKVAKAEARAVEDERMEQDLSVAVQSLKNRRADVVNLAAYQAGYLRESGLLANAFAIVRADDIRENAAVGSALAANQANAIRTSSLLTAAGTLVGGAGKAYAAR